MGKPTSRKSSASNLSVRSSSSAMNARKLQNFNKKKWANKNKKIKKLFQTLRDGSSCHDEPGVITLDDSSTQPETGRKRKADSKTDNQAVKKPAYSSVIILDDSSTATPRKKTSKVHCSTPLGDRASASCDLDLSCIKSAKNNNCILDNFNKEVNNLTNDIENGMVSRNYQTVDLTGEVDASTIIDLNHVDSQDCILLSTNTSMTSMSGDSQVTVVERPKSAVSEERKIRRVAKGFNNMIANLDSSSQGRLLEIITKNIFSGCNVPMSLKDSLKDRVPRIAETPEDIYIKEMFQGGRPSNSSVGSNIYNPEKHVKRTGPRTVVIDGSNVAMEHGRGREFSVRGLKICIDYFVNRGHEVRAFVPRFRCKFGKSTEPRLLDALERSGLVVYTPSREVQGKMITSYDDRYIVQYASAVDGVIVSGDNYRDVAAEHPRWRRTIERRLLPFTWVQDMIMFPRDPLGRNGPSLEQFLRHDS